MSNKDDLRVEKARVVLVGFEKEKDKYNFAKALANELGTTFDEATELIEDIPVELIQPLPMQAAENLADRLRVSGAQIDVVPLSRDLGGGRTCYRHPHKLAIAKCKVCGKLLCNVCLLESHKKLLCKEHYRRFQFARAIRYGGIAVFLTLFTFVYIFFGDSLTRMFRRVMPLATQRVALVVFTNQPDEHKSAFFNDLITKGSTEQYTEGDQHQLSDIDPWFQNQYRTLTRNDKTDIFDLDVYGLFDVSEPPPGFGFERESAMSLKDYVREIAERNKFTLTAYDLYLFVFITEKSPVKNDFAESLGRFEGRFGIFINPIEQEWSSDYYVMALANLLARIMGASLKLDDKGFPAYPYGYAQPDLDPLFPQPAAELLGLYIPTRKFEIKRPNSLDEVVIGPWTAYEMGWLSKSMANKVYRRLPAQ